MDTQEKTHSEPRLQPLEQRLQEAARWEPSAQMPLGLERRALAARPPLRPIGIARPYHFGLATAMAAACCVVIVSKLGQPTLQQEMPRQSQEMPRQLQQSLKQSQQLPRQLQEMPRQLQEMPKQLQQLPKRLRKQLAQKAPSLRKKQRESPLTRRYSVAVDRGEDSLTVGQRVSVDAPTYTPAYYAQPSADGESVTYTPVAVALDDPDVITSERMPDQNPL